MEGKKWDRPEMRRGRLQLAPTCQGEAIHVVDQIDEAEDEDGDPFHAFDVPQGATAGDGIISALLAVAHQLLLGVVGSDCGRHVLELLENGHTLFTIEVLGRHATLSLTRREHTRCSPANGQAATDRDTHAGRTGMQQMPVAGVRVDASRAGPEHGAAGRCATRADLGR